MALPSRRTSRVDSIVTFDGELGTAVLSQSVTLKLEDEIDLSRGDMLVSPDAPPSVSAHFSAAVVWLHETPLQLNRTYLVKHTTRQVKAKVTRIQYRVDVDTLSHEPAQELAMNEIAVLEIQTSGPLFFDSYEHSRTTGSFIVVDLLSNATVGAGMIREDLSKPQFVGVEQGNRTSGSVREREAVTPRERIVRNGHRPAIFVIPNRDSLAGSVDRALFELGFDTILLYRDSWSLQPLAPLLNLLWSAGLLVLLVTDNPPRETWQVLEAVAGNSLFNLSDEQSNLGSEKILTQILSHAESLKIRTTPKISREAD